MKPETWTVGKLLSWTSAYFGRKEVDNGRFDAEVLLAHVLKVSRLQLYTGYDRPVMQRASLDEYRGLVQRRAQHEPVAYLVGKRGFHNIELKVDRRVLIPRPETEMLVERGKAYGPRRILDVGTGSGAIALALLHELPEATAIATDISADAIDLARENAAQLGLADRIEFRVGPFFEPVQGERFDMLLANPPYIPNSVPLMADVVDYEPHVALFGGADGVQPMRTLLEQGHLYAPAFAFELGHDQGKAMCDFATRLGYSEVVLHRDNNGLDRVLEGRWSQ